MESFSDLDSTPESRIEDDGRISVIRRVQAVDPNGGRCLVENCSPARIVEYCHVVPRKLWRDTQLLDSLEWFWRMRKNTLNLETRRNIFAAGSAVHRMYDAGRLILVPEESIIQRYRDALLEDPARAVRETFPLIPDSDRFEYRLLPVKDMDEVYFARQNDPAIPMTLNAFTIHLPPFSTLPTFVSHVHPKFAIVSAGRKLAQMSADSVDDFEALKVTYPIVAKIATLFLAWSGFIPTTAEFNPTYYPPYDPDKNDDYDDEDNGGDDPKDKDYTSAVTEKGRYFSSSRKRLRYESPTPNRSRTLNPVDVHHDSADGETSGDPSLASKRKKSSNLSRASLSEHTRKIGKMEWNKDALINWSRNSQPPVLDGVISSSVVSAGNVVCV